MDRCLLLVIAAYGLGGCVWETDAQVGRRPDATPAAEPDLDEGSPPDTGPLDAAPLDHAPADGRPAPDLGPARDAELSPDGDIASCIDVGCPRPQRCDALSERCVDLPCARSVDCPEGSVCLRGVCDGDPCARLDQPGRCEGEVFVWCDIDGYHEADCDMAGLACRFVPQQGAHACIDPASLPELCGDGIDNDEDGQVDEGCGPGACGAGPGCPDGQACVDGQCLEGEICGDEVDNDGDGLIDEACDGDCQADIDCRDGWYCNLNQCLIGCRAGSCDVGSECNLETRSCQALACEAPADCPDGFRCERFEDIGLCQPE